MTPDTQEGGELNKLVVWKPRPKPAAIIIIISLLLLPPPQMCTLQTIPADQDGQNILDSFDKEAVLIKAAEAIHEMSIFCSGQF